MTIIGLKLTNIYLAPTSQCTEDVVSRLPQGTIDVAVIHRITKPRPYRSHLLWLEFWLLHASKVGIRCENTAQSGIKTPSCFTCHWHEAFCNLYTRPSKNKIDHLWLFEQIKLGNTAVLRASKALFSLKRKSITTLLLSLLWKQSSD